jgi:hypothetical protein
MSFIAVGLIPGGSILGSTVMLENVHQQHAYNRDFNGSRMETKRMKRTKRISLSEEMSGGGVERGDSRKRKKLPYEKEGSRRPRSRQVRENSRRFGSLMLHLVNASTMVSCGI